MIEIKNLSKSFEGIKALDNIDFSIEEGSIYGLVGSNGSGKSTLMRLISGVYAADGGEIMVDGQESLDNPTVKSQILFVGDTPYFLAQSNLKEMARLYEAMYDNFSWDTYNYLLTVFPLSQKAKLTSFSKGMQRQAALILALASKPKYLLLDEAFDGLDVIMRRVLANLLMENVEKNGMTAIIASHNLRELEDICNHIGFIHNGKLILGGQTDDVKNNIYKVQVAFKNAPEEKVFNDFDLIKIERTGSIYQIVVRGEKDEIMRRINSLFPVFAECIEPTLEEVFIFELEEKGYDIKNILS